MSEKFHFPPPAKLVFGLLASSRSILTQSKKIVAENFGPIDAEGEIIPFNATDFYCDEMGREIWRQFVSLEPLVPSENLADLKRQTNQLELQFAKGEKRQANLDPGLLTLDKLVVASTKPASYRIYLRDGIYAQPMLVFEKGAFRPWPWTYADYQWLSTLQFFNQVREIYYNQQKNVIAGINHG